MIPVTKPFLPPKEKVFQLLSEAWQREWLTNNGPLLLEFEKRLSNYLAVDQPLYVSNGTIALQIAIKALKLQGEIITTPFSFVATTSSIVWEGSEPVFVDIDPDTLNIDCTKIESAITPKTVAILATHCFGNACDIEAIDQIARRHKLPVIYDAAHCFGTRYKGKSIFEFGDVSTTSLHATKLMHSVEGGVIFSNDPALRKRMSYMRNFGHDGPEKFNGVGINGKNSEFHSAMGLVVLAYIEEILANRKQKSLYYDLILTGVDVSKPMITRGCDYNYAYYPVLFKTGNTLQRALKALNDNNIFPRRYFYPCLSKLDYVTKRDCPVATDVAERILCLPLYHTITPHEQDFVGSVLREVVGVTQRDPLIV